MPKITVPRDIIEDNMLTFLTQYKELQDMLVAEREVRARMCDEIATLRVQLRTLTEARDAGDWIPLE